MPCNFAQARECKARRATQKDNTIPANCLVGGFRLACVDAGYDLAAANSIRIQAKAATQGHPWVVSFFFRSVYFKTLSIFSSSSSLLKGFCRKELAPRASL